MRERGRVLLPELDKLFAFAGLGDLSPVDFPKSKGAIFDALFNCLKLRILRILEGVCDFAVLGRCNIVGFDWKDDCEDLNVFVEALKSVGTCFSLFALDEGLELKDLNGGPIEESFELGLELVCMGLSGLKKLDSLLRTAGDAANNVSIVLSDRDGRCLLGKLALLDSSDPYSSCVPSSSEESGMTGSGLDTASLRKVRDGFLSSALLAAFLSLGAGLGS